MQNLKTCRCKSNEETTFNVSLLEAANGNTEELWMWILHLTIESTRLAKFNILVQASASMLSQANAQHQMLH